MASTSKNLQKKEDESHYLCIVVHWKYVLPHRLVYNFSCLSLKIVNLALHWRWIFVFIAGWHVAETWWRYLNISWPFPIVKWWTVLSLKHHTKIRFCIPSLARQNNQYKTPLGWCLGGAITVAETPKQKPSLARGKQIYNFKENK